MGIGEACIGRLRFAGNPDAVSGLHQVQPSSADGRAESSGIRPVGRGTCRIEQQGNRR